VWKKPERSTLASVLAKPEALRPEKMPVAAWGSRAAVPPRKRGAAATPALPSPAALAADSVRRLRRWTTSAAGRAASVNPMAGLEQEVHEGGCRTDEKCRDTGGQYGLATGVGVLVVVPVASDRPGCSAKYEADQRGDERPPPETIGELLDRGLPGKS